jgi:tryptophan-rich sensory protein
MFLDRDDDPGKDLGRAARRPMLAFILVTLAVGAAASAFTEPQIATWYDHLIRPAYAPPDFVFPLVWTTLYVVMAVAAWRVWKHTGLNSTPIILYALQLVLNFAWCGIFFSLHRLDWALAEILVLDLAILATMLMFLRRDRWAAILFLPYLAWNLFASLLTYGFWRLNG